MSFKLLRKTHRVDRQFGVRISSGYSKDGTAEITVSFDSELQETFGLKAGDHLACYVGHDDDKGLLRLVKVSKSSGEGYALLRGGKQSTTLRFKRTVGKGWITGKNPATGCSYRMGPEAGVLEIELPEWAGGPPLYQDQKIAQIRPGKRHDEKGRPVKALSQ